MCLIDIQVRNIISFAFNVSKGEGMWGVMVSLALARTAGLTYPSPSQASATSWRFS